MISRFLKQKKSLVFVSLTVSLITLIMLCVFVPKQVVASHASIDWSESISNLRPAPIMVDIEANTLATYIPLAFHNYTPPSWALLGPKYADVATFEVDPTIPDVIYAGTYDEGLWRTQDGGQSWEILNNGLPTTYSVRHIATAPTTPTTIYISVDDPSHWIYRSLDGGESWQSLNPPANLRISALEVNPVTPAIVYVGIGVFDLPNYGGHVMRSLDGGENWEQILPYYTLANEIVIDPQDPRVLYIASTTDGVLKSINGGDSWQTMNEGLPQELGAWHMSIDIDTTQHLYLSASDGLYQTSNGGVNWKQVDLQSIPENYYSDFSFDSRSNTLFLASRSSTEPNPDCEGKIYSSVNNGQRWQYIANSPDNLCIGKITVINDATQLSIFIQTGINANMQVWSLSSNN